MFTLKIHWTRCEGTDPGPTAVVDQTDLFIPAETVAAHGEVRGVEVAETMQHWEPGSYQDYLCVTHLESADGKTGTTQFSNGRLICVTRDGHSEWYLATHAWLLGPDGKTIERLT
jgi:hypothetical protein